MLKRFQVYMAAKKSFVFIQASLHFKNILTSVISKDKERFS